MGAAASAQQHCESLRAVRVLEAWFDLDDQARGTRFSPWHFGQSFEIQTGLMPVPLHVGHVLIAGF
jgi:hypothetical protein